MGRYFGKIGFAINTEVEPDIWEDIIVERPYGGDVLPNSRGFNQGEALSTDIKVTNQFSIVGDTYLFKHLSDIRYITWRNEQWSVSTIVDAFPRITITLGGLWNGQTNEVEPNP